MIVLEGPAGTGKTLFAKHLANNIDGEFISIDHTEIEDKYVGESEKNIKKIFEKARKKANSNNKVILFFDEADSLFEKRTDKRNYKEGLISILLSEMDGIHENSLDNIFIFFTTNRLKAIDSAVLSRFDKKINIGLPKKEKRIEHFKSNIKSIEQKAESNVFGDLDYEILSRKTDGKSGRFIHQLVKNAVAKFAHTRLKNPRSKLITTQNIIDGISIIEKEENEGKEIGFHAKY